MSKLVREVISAKWIEIIAIVFFTGALSMMLVGPYASACGQQAQEVDAK